MDDRWLWEEVLALVQSQRKLSAPTFSSDRLDKLEALARKKLAEFVKD